MSTKWCLAHLPEVSVSRFVFYLVARITSSGQGTRSTALVGASSTWSQFFYVFVCLCSFIYDMIRLTPCSVSKWCASFGTTVPSHPFALTSKNVSRWSTDNKTITKTIVNCANIWPCDRLLSLKYSNIHHECIMNTSWVHREDSEYILNYNSSA
jgi:hypothetical protein